MEFKKREKYSNDISGFFYQISQDEFVYCALFLPSSSVYPITWMKGNKRIGHKIEYDKTFGVVGKSFFFEKDKIIKKADLINDKIVIVDSVKFPKEIKVYFYWFCHHYFIERDSNANVLFAFPINEDYRSNYGIKFNISIDELNKYNRILVHDKFLFGITRDENSSSIRRYRSDSEEYLETIELPKMFNEAVIFNNWIFYLSEKGDLISVNMNDLSYEIIKTNLGNWSVIVEIDENGMVNVQTSWQRSPVHLLTAQLPEIYITENRRTEKEEKEELLKRLENEQKHRNELERRLEEKKKKEEELLMNKEELEERNAIMGVEMKNLKLKYNKLLLRVRY